MPLPGPFADRLWGACVQRLACTAALWLWGLALAWPHGAAAQQRVVLPTATDLPQALAQAQAQGQPLVVMVSLDNCPYCRQVRQSHLGPLWRSGQAVVQINMQHTETLTDGDGQVRSHAEWVKRRKVSVAPRCCFWGRVGAKWPIVWRGHPCPTFTALTSMSGWPKPANDWLPSPLPRASRRCTPWACCKTQLASRPRVSPRWRGDRFAIQSQYISDD